jgi:nucleoside-diphosphate-sugar epimerase
MKILVTGASGFIGRHLVPMLLERGHVVTCLVRDPARATAVLKGAQFAHGDVTDRDSIHSAMKGAEAVFHLAAWYTVGAIDKAKMRAINVEGTRNILETTLALGVQKIIYTSTVGVFGNTHGLTVDESYHVNVSALSSEYERTKWQAHYEVAVPLQRQGAPIVIVQPGIVIGPGDASPVTSFYDLYFRRTPILLGALSGGSWAHVDDIAAGHRLALERGKSGESYIIAGPVLTYREAMLKWQTLTGIPAPRFWLPGWTASLMAQVMSVAEQFGARSTFSSEALRSLADSTWNVSADKAKRELGWQPRPIDAAFKETLEYEMKTRGITA